jgi:hypothetical protein
MDVTINQKPINVPADLATWGDVLDWLETDQLKAGQCITHVFLGNEEAINYRNQTVCRKDLDVVGKVQIEVGDFDTVVRESLIELDQELQSAMDSAQEIIRLLEDRQPEEAYEQLAQLLDSVRTFFTVFSEDLGWAEQEAQSSRDEISASLENALTQLISAQQNGFWVSICDVLEYELTPVLESWKKLVEGTRVRIN